MTSARNPEKMVAWLLASVLLGFGFLVVMPLVTRTEPFLAFLGFAPGKGGPLLAWLLAAAITVYYCWGVAKIPAVGEWMFRRNSLKGLAVVAALMAGVVEEVIFRRWLMDWLDRNGVHEILQVLASGIAFGAAHAIWGFIGRSAGAALHAMLATAIVGLALGVVYLAAGRSLAPCIAAHFVMTALAEPGLMLGAMRGQLGKAADGAR